MVKDLDESVYFCLLYNLDRFWGKLWHTAFAALKLFGKFSLLDFERVQVQLHGAVEGVATFCSFASWGAIVDFRTKSAVFHSTLPRAFFDFSRDANRLRPFSDKFRFKSALLIFGLHVNRLFPKLARFALLKQPDEVVVLGGGTISWNARSGWVVLSGPASQIWLHQLHVVFVLDDAFAFLRDYGLKTA